MGSSRQLRLRDEAKPALEEILEAIDDEIAAVERDPATSFEVTDGRRLHRGVGGSLYALRAELVVALAPETPIRVVAGDRRVRGTLISVDDFEVIVHLDDDVGEDLSRARVSSQPAFILERLRERLLGVEGPRPGELPAGLPATLAMAEPARPLPFEGSVEEAASALEALPDPALTPNVAQGRAMSRVAGNDLHFVWGPPGTGKTANLAQIARMLVDGGSRVLVLAHANVAVDVAALRVGDAFARTVELAENRILRYGPTQSEHVLARPELLIESAIAKSAPQVAEQKARLERARRDLLVRLRGALPDVERDVAAAELRRVRQELAGVRRLYRETENEVLAGSAVVCATLSRLVITEGLWELRPDAILLDEASMIPFPWALAAATRAQARLVVLGDFRQLPPVLQSKSAAARRWLGRDAFDVAGVRARIDAGEDDERVTLLDVQYRMAEPIAATVSDLAYGGRLVTEPSVRLRTAPLVEAAPWPGHAVIVADTSELASACHVEARVGSFSRVNPVQALLALGLAEELEGSTALITPYRAHARILEAAVRDLALDSTAAATIHRFQGSERDNVVFDLVDAAPLHEPSRLTGGDVDLALRLTNVALSRARGKAIVVADCDALAARMARESPVRQALALCERNGHRVRVSPEDVALAFERRTIEWVDDPSAAMIAVHAAIASASWSLVANFPRGFDVPVELVDEIRARASSGVETIVLGSPTVAAELEATPADLRLLPLPGLFVATDRSLACVGGTSPGLTAIVRSPEITRILTATLVGDVA
jgi:hypothetical protein